jgi:hypothetical protein
MHIFRQAKDIPREECYPNKIIEPAMAIVFSRNRPK